jgi:single-stranded-DNA-specific exonuclease
VPCPTTTCKRWRVADPAPPDYLRQLPDLHPTIAQVLYNRNLDPGAARHFLAVDLPPQSPFRLKGMHQAVDRLRSAIRNREPVVVYGDFDADGVTATVLLTEALRALGANARPYIPHRVDEGYGINSPALRRLADEGVRVVVTVDCGIRSIKEVKDGISFGLDIIISDHHSVGSEMPPALAVVNPKQAGCAYPDKSLAGVGLAYKIACALHMVEQQVSIGQASEWQPDSCLDLVAIGTVADLAPLQGENRALVRRGLGLLNQPARPGLYALYKEVGLRPGEIDSSAISYALGPRINAAGRLEHANLAYDLLTADEPSMADAAAQQLQQINQRRQQLTEEMQAAAEGLALPNPQAIDETPLLFAADPGFLAGIVGLVASRLTEAYYRPSVVVEKGEEESRGSCRSIPEFHITHALDECADLLTRYGGHAAAAGFTVPNENLEALGERLTDIARAQLGGLDLTPALDIDAEFDLHDLSGDLLRALQDLEPTGEANPPPLFVSRDMEVLDHRLIGREESHLKITLSDGRAVWDAIAFRQAHRAGDLAGHIDVVYHLEVNEWGGQQRLQLNVQDWHPSGAPPD